MAEYKSVSLETSAPELRVPQSGDVDVNEGSGRVEGYLEVGIKADFDYLTGNSSKNDLHYAIVNGLYTPAVGDMVSVSAYSSSAAKQPATWRCTSISASLPSGATAGDVTGNALGILYVLKTGATYNKFEISTLAYAEAFGAVKDGATDDTTAIQAAINLAEANGGGDVYLRTGEYLITDTLTIDDEKVILKGAGPGTVIKMSGSEDPFIGINIVGAGGTGSFTLSGDVDKGLSQIDVTSVATLSVGQYLLFEETQSSIGAVFTFISRVTAIASLTVTLEGALPFDITAANCAVNRLGMISGSGIENLTIDGSAASGACTGVTFRSCNAGKMRNINLESVTGAAASVDTNYGLDIAYENIILNECGDVSGTHSDFQVRRSTGAFISNIVSKGSPGFGPKLVQSSYCNSDGWQSHGSDSRGLKLQSCVACNFDSLICTLSSTTGISITNGTKRCNFTGLVAIGCTTEGIWFSAQENTENNLVGITTYANTDYDIALNSTDENNNIVGFTSSAVIRDLGANNAFGEPGIAWITPTFSAGNFTASGSMTWTVASGDIVTNAYQVIGKTLIWNIDINTSTIGGTPSDELRIAIPASLVSQKAMGNFGFRITQAGTPVHAYAYTSASGTTVNIKRLDDASLSASTDGTRVSGQIMIEIA